MLVECGFTCATTSDGREYTFTPSLGRIARLDSPRGLVELYAALHGARAPAAASEVLAGLCDQDDASELIGQPEPTDTGIRWVGGLMADAERVVIAKHLLMHGMVGAPRAGRRRKGGSGAYSETFDADEYIHLARVHLGMSAADAEALSMTELHRLLAVKFPEAADKEEIPTAEAYEAAMRALLPQNEGVSRGV